MAGSAWMLNEDDGAPEYHAAQLRRLLGGLLFGGVSHRLGARQGVRPGPPVVELSGTTVQVLGHQGVIYPADSSTQGPYPYEEVGESLPLDPPDGSQTRVDLVVERLYDDDVDSSGERKVEPELVAGTPGGGAPSVPAGALELARVTVPSSGSPSLTYTAPAMAAAGGTVPVQEDAELPTAGRYAGMKVWHAGLGMELVWDGDVWRPTADKVRLDRVDLTGTIGSGTDLEVPELLRGRFSAYEVEVEATAVGESLRTLMIYINGDNSANYRVQAWAEDATSGDRLAFQDTGATAFPRHGFMGQFGPSLSTVKFVPRSGFMAWVGDGFAHEGASGSARVFTSGRYAGPSTAPEFFRVRSSVSGDEWGPASNARLYGIR